MLGGIVIAGNILQPRHQLRDLVEQQTVENVKNLNKNNKRRKHGENYKTCCEEYEVWLEHLRQDSILNRRVVN